MHWKPDKKSHLTVHVQIIERIKTRFEQRRIEYFSGTNPPLIHTIYVEI